MKIYINISLTFTVFLKVYSSFKSLILDIVDEDNSGTLDSAECESLFRLLYHTNELSSKVRQIIIEVDAHSGGTLSFGIGIF